MNWTTDSKGRLLLSGNEAIALSALHCGVHLGCGYPGTPSTEILENLSALGGKAQWAPNEKVAAEVALGASFGNARALVTMKHVGLNVAADVLFTATHSGAVGGYVLIVADDPGMASSQNEQDSRRYAEAAGAPMFEPSDAQEAYDMLRIAFETSERWGTPVIFRVSTRVCHSKSIVKPRCAPDQKPAQTGAPTPNFVRNIPAHVMVPGYAKPAHRRLRTRLLELQTWNETSGPNRVEPRSKALGIICSGINYAHVREAAPDASILKIGMSYPLPWKTIREFVKGLDRCVVIEENDPWLATQIKADGLTIEAKDDTIYRFGEFNVERIRRILAHDSTPEVAPPKGKAPALCVGCPHRSSFEVLKELNCIVSGDIGCYTLAALPPFESMDLMIDMGASIGMGLGLRHVLPREQAKRVVSVIGDSTCLHSGVTGLIETAYNVPESGHVIIVLDNGITAMTGQQDHPGTGRRLNGNFTHRVDFETLAKACGIQNTLTINPVKDREGFKNAVATALQKDELTFIVAKSPCILAAAHIMDTEKGRKVWEANQNQSRSNCGCCGSENA